MNIPTYLAEKWTKEDGYLTDSADMYQDELNRVMQESLSDNGWVVPTITQGDLASLESDPNTAMPNGTMWYVVNDDGDPPYNELVVKINSSLRKVSTAAYP